MTAPRICVVTGATRGIGEATAAGLLRAACDVTLIVRDDATGNLALDRLERSTGRRARLVVADLADLRALASAARGLVESLPRVDVLINNAAAIPAQRTTTKDGVETQFGVNHLAHHLLTRELIPALAKSTDARVVVVASNAHRHGRIDLDDLEAKRHYDARKQYQATKLMNVLFAREMATRLLERRIAVNSLHPGVIGTGLLVDYTPLGRFVAPLVRALAGDAESGARTSLFVALAPELTGISGKHFKQCREVAPSSLAFDESLRRAFFDRCEEYFVGV